MHAWQVSHQADQTVAKDPPVMAMASDYEDNQVSCESSMELRQSCALCDGVQIDHEVELRPQGVDVGYTG
jgi:hypothetical protein